MTQNLLLETIPLTHTSVSLYVPEPTHVKALYQLQLNTDTSTPFPYWSQVWPAAIAMAEFLALNPCFIHNKTVLELAAGLGLPSLVAAKVAKEVYCTDYLPEAISVIEQSITHNQLKNMNGGLLDWNKLPTPLPQADIVLLSDINYNPADFDRLHQVLKAFLQQGSTLLLTTPQRLLAKPFIEMLLPWCRLKEEVEVVRNRAVVSVTVLVLALEFSKE